MSFEALAELVQVLERRISAAQRGLYVFCRTGAKVVPPEAARYVEAL